MRFFKLRYALIGWLVTRLARRRLERRLHAAARLMGHGGLLGRRRWI